MSITGSAAHPASGGKGRGTTGRGWWLGTAERHDHRDTLLDARGDLGEVIVPDASSDRDP
jgi:hypothetical protein